jgi:thioredoxin-like negative regulator of GroEL
MRWRPRARATLLLLVPFTIAGVLGAYPAHAAPPAAEGWLDDLAAARERATREDKPILVDLWAEWCAWCVRLEQEVFSTPAFREFASGYVLLRVDTDDGADGTRLMEDFEVASLPTTLLVTPDLVEIGELAGFAPADQYVLSLELEAALFATLVRTYDDHVSARSAAPSLQTLADDFHARRDGARAVVLYRELLARGSDNPEEDAWNRYYYADSLRLQRAWEEARQAAAVARERAAAVDDDELHERIDLLPYYMARDAAACGEALDALERFVAEHPDGLYVGAATAAMRRIKSTQRCA